MKRRRIAAFFLFLAAARQAAAQAEYFPAASAFAPGLGLPPCPQAAGMADAYSAVAEGASALAWNPAALDLLSERQLVFIHNEWNAALGMRQEYLAYSQKAGLGGLGVALNYFNLGELESRDRAGNLSGHALASDLSLSLGYGGSFFSPDLHLGLMPEFGLESTGSSSGASAGLSLGALYQWGMLSLGSSLMHAGIGPGGSRLPTVLRAGAAYRLRGPGLLLAAEASSPWDAVPSLSAGLEWKAGGALKLRAGWRQQLGSPLEDALSGPTAGLGLKAGFLHFDYAFVPHGPFPAAHRLAATLSFSEDLFRPKLVVQPESPTVTAKIFSDQGEEYLKRGQRLEALVAFKQSLEALPGDEAALQKVRKIEIELKTAYAKGSKDPAVMEMITKKMASGDRRFRQGDYVGAMKEWELVLQVDPDSKEAYQKISDAREKLNRKLDSIVTAGDQALTNGDQKNAVKKFRQALALDPRHAPALSRLETLRPRILAQIQMLHRLGIEQYVRGKYSQALQTWRVALELDPSDPGKLQRDIDRAVAKLRLAKN